MDSKFGILVRGLVIYNSKIKRELTSLKFDLYFMRCYDEGLREDPASTHARHSSKQWCEITEQTVTMTDIVREKRELSYQVIFIIEGRERRARNPSS